MRIVFMGTPDFAVASLKSLVEAGHEVCLVVTREDKPKGRGQQMAFSDVKEYALTKSLPIYQPKSLRNDEARDTIAACKPDVIVVVAYGRILPAEILSIPPYGCVNVHGSLLPRYRGAAPIQWAVLNGDAESGVTTMLMDVGLDTGDMLLQSRRAIPETMTAGELFDLLSLDGAALLIETLKALEAGTVNPTPQGEDLVSYASMLDRSYSPISWENDAQTLHNRVRGLNPWPSATCQFAGKTLKIHVSRVGAPCNAPAGTVVSTKPLTIACGGGTSLELLEVQYEGSRRMSAADFLCGHPITVGELLK
ncbi:MAG: methionyl-tRNA formyltransferase [Ruminococcaceae bacterium]|nr:methionyl-tRNA formyltransferase [Oscillospiraceae bacterium]